MFLNAGEGLRRMGGGHVNGLFYRSSHASSQSVTIHTGAGGSLISAPKAFLSPERLLALGQAEKVHWALSGGKIILYSSKFFWLE